MSELVREAKTVESAIQSALKDLNCTRDEVEVEILQEPVKGIFGLAKFAKVRVTKVTEDTEEIEAPLAQEERPVFVETSDENLSEKSRHGKEILLKILELMDIRDAKIRVVEEESNIYLDIYSQAEGLLIGRHGQTLSSLQYVINRIVNHDPKSDTRFIVDIGGYRDRHRTILEKMASRIAKRVTETNEEEELKAMNAFDRRIIHMSVKDNPDVVSYSLGEGNFRRVVIAPKSKQKPQENQE